MPLEAVGAMARHLLLALAFACITAGCQAHFVNFTLPNLPYSTSVFEPNIDNTTMYLHWFKCAAAAGAGASEIASAGDLATAACCFCCRNATCACWLVLPCPQMSAIAASRHVCLQVRSCLSSFLCRHTQTYATKLNDAILTTCLGQGLALTPLSQLVQKVGATVPCGSIRCKAIRNTDCETAVSSV